MRCNFTITEIDGRYHHKCPTCRKREVVLEAPGLVRQCSGSPADSVKCVHRGNELRVIECGTCATKTRIKVFQCALHGECSVARDVGVRVCSGCQDKSTAAVERCYVVSLDRRSDRYEQFTFGLPKDWPFPRPERFSAIDGQFIKPPLWWHQGAPAWGCYRSHLSIIERCMNEGIESVLILEDDAAFPEDFTAKAQEYVANLPPDWEMAYFGGQHLGKPVRKVSDLAVVPKNVNRTHAYAIRGKEFMQRLYRHLHDFAYWQPKHHIDHQYGKMHEAGKCKVYAPTEWLVGQRSGPSDITRKEESDRTWNSRRFNVPAARQAAIDFSQCFPDAMPFCGTLLGMMRDKDLIPWDNDVDFAVPHTLGSFSGDSFKKVGPFTRFAAFHHKGTESEWAYRHENGTRVDLWRLLPSQDGMLELAAFPDEFPKVETVVRRIDPDWFTPPKPALMWNHQFLFPANPEACLEACYGANWRVPDRKYSPHAPLAKSDSVPAVNMVE